MADHTSAKSLKSFLKSYCPVVVSAYRRLSARRVPPDPENLWHRLLNRLATRRNDMFFVQVGAMDGISFDPLHEHIIRHNWRGLLVEPLSDLFAELKQTYDGMDRLLFENVAVADDRGQRDMYRICKEAIHLGKVPYWAKGVSTFTEPRNMLGPNSFHKEELELMRPYIITETVRCETLAALFSKHQIRSIDIFVTDVEGYDYEVLRQLDFTTYRPSLIRIEWANLSESHKRMTLDLLGRHGYRTRVLKLDLVAWKRHDQPAPNWKQAILTKLQGQKERLN